MIALVITMVYTLTGGENGDDVTTENTPRPNKPIRPARSLNDTEIFNLMLFTTWPINGK